MQKMKLKDFSDESEQNSYIKGIYYLNENNPATGFSVPVCLQITNIFR